MQESSNSTFFSRLKESFTGSDRDANPLVIIFLLTALALFAVLAYLIYNAFFRPSPYGGEVDITNISQVDNLSEDEQSLILHNLYEILKETETDSNLEKEKGTIRTETIVSELNELTQIHSGSFIVDFDNLEQSFEVTFEYAVSDAGKRYTSGYNVVVSCISDESLVKYPDSACPATGTAVTYTPEQKLSASLPHDDTTASDQEYYMFYRHYSDGRPYVEVATNSCGDQALLSSALDAAKAWISSLGLDPSAFSYETPSTYCEGGY